MDASDDSLTSDDGKTLEASYSSQHNNIQTRECSDDKNLASGVEADLPENLDEEEELVEKKSKAAGGFTGRGATLQTLLEEKILEPKDGAMSLEYMGQKFVGDLLPDGKIFSAEIQEAFSSPSAWALRCKRMVNPEQKYGCGWSSVRYCGKPLDVYKNSWLRKRRLEHEVSDTSTPDECSNLVNSSQQELHGNQHSKVAPAFSAQGPVDREIVKHGNLGNRSSLEDRNLLVESIPFSSIGKLQPFLLTMSPAALVMIDIHCSLSRSEVVGYLGGTWDINSNTLAVRQAYPCLGHLNDEQHGQAVENKIAKIMDTTGNLLVGWYHSHPSAPPTPTIQDIDTQLDYQLKLKGTGEQGYRPCIGLISSPLLMDNAADAQSRTSAFWVYPPPENKPNEIGRPMAMSYTVSNDNNFKEALSTIKECLAFYKDAPDDCVELGHSWNGEITILDKMKACVREHIYKDDDICTFNDLLDRFAISESDK